VLSADNVHFQHTAQFIRALMEADVDFRVHVSVDINLPSKIQLTHCKIISLWYKNMYNINADVKVIC